MNELETQFDKKYEKCFKSKSMDKIQEGLDLARSKGAFVFMPSPMLSYEQSVYMPIVDRVFLREDEIYMSAKNYRIHFNGLLRMSIAAAFEWSSIDCCRTDKQNDKLYCAFQSVGGVRKADGRVYFHQAKDDIDIEVLEMEFEDKYSADWEKVKDFTGNQAWKKYGHNSKESFVNAMVRRDVIQKRKNMRKLAESGAKSRVIRFVLGLQSQYSDKKQLIGMPFIFVYYAMNQFHDAIKPLLMNAAPKMISQIYGGAEGMGENEHADAIEIDAVKIPDSELEPDQDQNQAETEGTKFQPQQSKANSSLTDFENIPVDEQAKTLKTMCDDCGQSYENYNTEVKGGIKKAGQDWRNEFFNFLKGEKEKKK